MTSGDTDMEVVIQQNGHTKSDILKLLQRQHEAEIESRSEWCEQRIVWQDGKIVAYEKLEKYR